MSSWKNQGLENTHVVGPLPSSDEHRVDDAHGQSETTAAPIMKRKVGTSPSMAMKLALKAPSVMVNVRCGPPAKI